MGSGEKGSSEGNEVKSSSEMPVKVSKLGQNFLRGFTFFVLDFFFFFTFIHIFHSQGQWFYLSSLDLEKRTSVSELLSTPATQVSFLSEKRAKKTMCEFQLQAHT